MQGISGVFEQANFVTIIVTNDWKIEMDGIIGAMRALKCRDKNIDWYYILMIFCIILAYAVYLPKHLSIDSWNVQHLYAELDQIGTGHLKAIWSEALQTCFVTGRFFRGFIFLAFASCRAAHLLVSPWVNWVALFFMCLSGERLWTAIRNMLPAKATTSKICFTCCVIVLCNPFFTDWMEYIECQLYYPLALWLAISAAITLQRDNPRFKEWFSASILLVLSSGLYQIALQFFVLVSVCFIILGCKAKDIKDQIWIPIKRILLAISVYGVAAGMQLCIARIVRSNRVQEKTLIEIIGKTSSAQSSLWKMIPYTKNILSILFSLVALLLIIRFMWCLFHSELAMNGKIVRCLVVLSGFVGYYGALFLPLIVSELWFSQRSMVGFWGILLILAVAEECVPTDQQVTAHDIKIDVIWVMLVVLLISNISSCVRFGTDLYKVNAIDKMRGELISNLIADYERETGISIANVAFRQDVSFTYAYPETVNFCENNQAAWSASWNYLSILETVSNRKFQQCEYTEDIYNKYYGNGPVDWNEFSEEQIHFESETAYIMVY